MAKRAAGTSEEPHAADREFWSTTAVAGIADGAMLIVPRESSACPWKHRAPWSAAA